MYTYDNNGNIVERCEYDYTSKTGEELSELECEHFSYDYEGDKLVSYNVESCTYNSLGNPTTYLNKAVTWQYGKYLASYNGTTFTYDGLSRRVTKGGITFTYDNENNLIKQSNGFEFIYDDKGIVGVKYNGAQYFYRKDAQGNIIAILDSSGKIVVEYKYDNGYVFYLNEDLVTPTYFPYQYLMAGYNDDKNRVVFFGMVCVERLYPDVQYGETDLGLYLKIFFGDWYDFDA